MMRPTYLPAAALFATALLVPFGGGIAADPVTAEERQRVETIVRDYLLEHPEVIVEAIEILQRRERTAEEERQRRSLSEFGPKLYDDPMSPVSGAADGDIVLVEFFDYQCGYCKRVLPTVLDLLEEDGKLKVVWKELPILGPASLTAARAAMAADRQGRYLDFHSTIMGLRGPLSEDRIMAEAEGLGLDMDRLRADMRAPEVEAHLRENLQLAQALGINGTPAFIVGDRIYPGALDPDQMRELIAAARDGKS